MPFEMRAPCAFLLASFLFSTAVAGAAGSFKVPVQIGPLGAGTNRQRTIVFDHRSVQQKRWFDVQDGRQHNVRGVPLRGFMARVAVSRAVDAVIFAYADGMQIPVRLVDRPEVDSIFVALEHGDAKDSFTTTYLLHDTTELPCPKIVSGRKIIAYSIWLYPTRLASIRLVNWKAYQDALAVPTAGLADHSGWPLYVQHCQPCHGIGGLGATRGPDLLTDLDAYRRIPAPAPGDFSRPQPLHQKAKGYSDGTVPVLNHVPDADTATVWRWLQALHKRAKTEP